MSRNILTIAFTLAMGLILAGCTKAANEATDAVRNATETTPTESTMVKHKTKCPQAVIERIQTVDLTSSDNAMLFSWIINNSDDVECHIDALIAIAERLDDSADQQVIGNFCSSAATYARFLNPEQKKKIKDAYLRFPFYLSIARDYFSGLRQNAIDIRPHLKGKVKEDWTFKRLGLNDATWYHYLYLAKLNDPGAYEAIEKKLEATTHGNDASNLLTSLADVVSERTKNILLKYRKDPRRADTPEGPGLGSTIAETVASLLEVHY